MGVCCKVAANQSGSLVYKIDPLAPAHSVLKENDVVMEIDSVPIADDGTVEFRNEERVEFSHIVRAKHIGQLLQTPRGLSDCLSMWQLSQKEVHCTSSCTCICAYLVHDLLPHLIYESAFATWSCTADSSPCVAANWYIVRCLACLAPT